MHKNWALQVSTIQNKRKVGLSNIFFGKNVWLITSLILSPAEASDPNKDAHKSIGQKLTLNLINKIFSFPQLNYRPICNLHPPLNFHETHKFCWASQKILLISSAYNTVSCLDDPFLYCFIIIWPVHFVKKKASSVWMRWFFILHATLLRYVNWFLLFNSFFLFLFYL